MIQINVTWHLVLMIVISIAIIVRIFRESDGPLDLSAFIYGLLLLGIWVAYGSIFIW